MRTINGGANTVSGLLEWGARLLGGGLEGRIEAEVLLGHAMGRTREWMVAHGSEQAGAAGARFKSLAGERRMTGIPVAYLTGEREFHGLRLRVGSGVLVPRPETEGLVDLVLEWLRGSGREFPGGAVIDAGCGSGAVALALASRSGREVVGIDISEEAVACARTNAEQCGLAGLARFVRGNWLEPASSLNGGPRICAVVSNPPYIPSGDLPGLPRDVRDFEPPIALDGGSDGLDCIRRVEEGAWSVLPRSGLLALEIGADQGAAVERILGARGWKSVRICTDLAGLTRYATAERG